MRVMTTKVTIDVHEYDVSEDRTVYTGVIYDARTGSRMATCVRSSDRDTAYDAAKSAAEESGWIVLEY